MNIQAIIFGGIGSLVETSELQRAAFNRAFSDAALDWHWDREVYRHLLGIAGGQRRIRMFNRALTGEQQLSDGDIAMLHERKSEIFLEMLADARLEPRSGVRRLIQRAQHADAMIATASTTSLENITAVARAAGLDLNDFAVVLHRGSVDRPKPDPQVYERALAALGVAAAHAVAIEDSESGLAAASGAGIRCVAAPGENTTGQDFGQADRALRSVEETLDAAGELAAPVAPRISGLDLPSFRALVADIR